MLISTHQEKKGGSPFRYLLVVVMATYTFEKFDQCLKVLFEESFEKLRKYDSKVIFIYISTLIDMMVDRLARGILLYELDYTDIIPTKWHQQYTFDGISICTSVMVHGFASVSRTSTTIAKSLDPEWFNRGGQSIYQVARINVDPTRINLDKVLLKVGTEIEKDFVIYSNDLQTLFALFKRFYLICVIICDYYEKMVNFHTTISEWQRPMIDLIKSVFPPNVTIESMISSDDSLHFSYKLE